MRASQEDNTEVGREAPGVQLGRHGTLPALRAGRLAGYTLKLSPQEQLALAFGLANLKPPAISLLE